MRIELICYPVCRTGVQPMQTHSPYWWEVSESNRAVWFFRPAHRPRMPTSHIMWMFMLGNPLHFWPRPCVSRTPSFSELTDKKENRIVTQRYAFWFSQPALDNRLMVGEVDADPTTPEERVLQTCVVADWLLPYIKVIPLSSTKVHTLGKLMPLNIFYHGCLS